MNAVTHDTSSAAAAIATRALSRRWFPAVAGGGALAVGVLTIRGRGRDLDDRMYKILNGSGTPLADHFFKAITELGSIYAPIAATATLSARGQRREAFDAMGAACVTWGVCQLLKKAFARLRPYQALAEFRLLIRRLKGSSWPSSHPAVLLTYVTVASRNIDASQPVKFGLVALAAAVGSSRVYLGVHYPADVLGGLLVGRGLADLWSAAVSPVVLKRLPSVAAPVPLIEE